MRRRSRDEGQVVPLCRSCHWTWTHTAIGRKEEKYLEEILWDRAENLVEEFKNKN